LTVIDYKGVTLDTGKSTVGYNDRVVELTKNELRILNLLMKKKEQITTRDEIMNELWQSDEFVDDNTLTVNINRLRKKLSEIGVEDYLKTKRGQGYCL
jgi:DNA-binding response OmpR family regulator